MTGDALLRIAGLAIAAALALAVAGCLRDPDPIEVDEDAVAVHALLETGADTVLVLVSRPGPRDAPGGPYSAYVGISDADVRFVDAGDTTWLVEDRTVPCVGDRFGRSQPQPGDGCYRTTLDRPIQPGATYALEITLPDGTRVTGTATPPAAPDLRSPEPGQRVTVECGQSDRCDPAPGPQNPPGIRPVASIPVGWERPTFVAGIQVHLRPTVAYLDGSAYPGDACSFGRVFGSAGIRADTMDFEIANVYCGSPDDQTLSPARFDSIRAELTIYGLDRHYTEYVENSFGQGIREETASQGLDGAYGVFGAMAPSSRTITLVRDPPPDAP